MGHTPGPWRVVHRVNVEAVDGRRGIATCGGYQNGTDETMTENEANANLIAAAPDMYDALRIIAEYFKLAGIGDGMLNIAEAAIKKAKGA